MREIKCWINDGAIYQYPHYIMEDKVEQYIGEWRMALFQKCKEANADHYVYAVKTVDDDCRTQEVDIYMLPLNDEDFFERTISLQKEKNVIIYAWHKGTAY